MTIEDAGPLGIDVGEADSVGALLRRAREARGLTIDQVTARTRVRPHLVVDLEHDRFESCGGAVYARGHVRAVGRAVGADVVRAVSLLDAQLGEGPPELPPGLEPLPPRQLSSLARAVAAPAERRTPAWSTAAVSAFGVLLLLVAVGVLRDGRPGDGVGTTPVAAEPAPSATASAPPPPPPPPAPGARLAVEVAGTGSWLRVTGSGGLLFEGVADAGWSQAFTDDVRLDVRIGNAGAVRLACGDAPAAVAGAVGAVEQVACPAA